MEEMTNHGDKKYSRLLLANFRPDNNLNMIFPNDIRLKKPSESFSIISAMRNLMRCLEASCGVADILQVICESLCLFVFISECRINLSKLARMNKRSASYCISNLSMHSLILNDAVEKI